MTHLTLTPPWNGSVVGTANAYFIRLCLVSTRKFGVLSVTSGKVQCYLSLN